MTVVAVVALGIVAVGAAGTAGAVGGPTVDGDRAAIGGVQTNETNTTGGTVAGTVTDGDGSPVANATVTVGETATTTNATGGYAVELAEGSYALAVSVDGEQVATRSVNVTAGETTVVDVSVTVTATVRGTVTDVDGEPISSVSVDLREPGGFEDTAGFPDEYVARTQPAADGSYELAVEAGEYVLGAGSVEYALSVTNVSLSPGETLTRNLTLERADGGITGTVTDQAGTPIANATVGTLNGTASTTTGADGTFDLTLAAGEYTVVADADGYRETTHPVIVQSGVTVAFDPTLTAVNESQSPLTIAIDGTSGPVAPGDTLAVDASVTNVDSESVGRTVTLDVAGEAVDDTYLSVPGGETQSVTLLWTTSADDEGSYTATVRSEDATASTLVSVDPSLNGTDGDTGDENTTDGSTGTDDGSDGTDTDDGTDPNFDTGEESALGFDTGGAEDVSPDFDTGDGSGDSGLNFDTGDDSGDSGLNFDTGDDSGDSGLNFDTGDDSGDSGLNFDTGEGSDGALNFDTGGGSDTGLDFATGGDSGAMTFDFGTETSGFGFEFEGSDSTDGLSFPTSGADQSLDFETGN